MMRVLGIEYIFLPGNRSVNTDLITDIYFTTFHIKLVRFGIYTMDVNKNAKTSEERRRLRLAYRREIHDTPGRCNIAHVNKRLFHQTICHIYYFICLFSKQ